MTKNWPPCGRIAHLAGGLTAQVEPMSDQVILWPQSIDGKEAQISIPTFGRLYYALEKYDLCIVGVEFITDQSEYLGEAPTQFRGYAKQQQIWPNWDSFQLWRSLALSSFEAKDGLGYDLSNRISYQLNALNDKLKNLSIKYRDQLNAIVLKNDFIDGQRFHDGFTNLVYQEFHSFLFEAGILRDYLCEYVYNFSSTAGLKLTHKNSEKIQEITTANGLLKALNNAPELSELEEQLKISMAPDGWLFELGIYRDLVMHTAPISIASHQLYAIQIVHEFPDGKQFPSVRFPLPDNIESVYKDRCRRGDFRKYIEQFDALCEKSLDEYGKYDCLEYANKIHGLLSNLALSIGGLSPNEPKRMVFTKTHEGTNAGTKFIGTTDEL
ncbi:hypothetical protein [Vibrio breoganii]|uniref:hypothetical protein n=1 Tax=Vibrio breoganii TaxID=553239 RepID=UPI000C81E85B|nr:hypothetical protein [Vibrio breoganii]PML40807.1 hypothetical protein BCT77_06015 [Vibrio breoganii]PMM18161.1 hypothetical protein BCT59_01450 [Vibrio breoganii]PMO79234.1 hypothetical protein BCT02_04875 [Vibrio breoganii]PMO86757.1 hypothetical protein BCS99_02025 [Vibrio breoganii]